MRTLEHTPVRPKQNHSVADLEAGDRLLRAVKEKILQEKGRIDDEDLRIRGYSEALIERLKEI